MTVWIVGASTGIGKDLVYRFLDDGHTVIASARSASGCFDAHDNLYCVDIDVSDAQSTQKAFDDIVDKFKRIDWWFYNAGAYEVMSLDQWDLAHFEQMNTVNYIGVVRLMILLRDVFIDQGGGRWIWNLSLSGDFGLPFGGGYSAPKAALCNLAQSIHGELLSQGIELTIINHGFVKTKLTDKNTFDMPQLMTTQEASAKIYQALMGKYRFEIRFPKALGFVLGLLKRLPYGVSLKINQWIAQNAK